MQYNLKNRKQVFFISKEDPNHPDDDTNLF
jgi:hypothetical protein